MEFYFHTKVKSIYEFLQPFYHVWQKLARRSITKETATYERGCHGWTEENFFFLPIHGGNNMNQKALQKLVYASKKM